MKREHICNYEAVHYISPSWGWVVRCSKRGKVASKYLSKEEAKDKANAINLDNYLAKAIMYQSEGMK